MARTAVAITSLSSARDNLPAGIVAAPAGVALDPANGHSVAGAFTSANDVFLFVDHTTVSTKTLTIKAGVNPPAVRASIGDLVLTLAASTKHYVGPFDGSQYCQADGSLFVDVQAAATGTISALRIKRDV